MPKQKFNIRVHGENETHHLKQVTGELITVPTLGMKAFIVKNKFDYSITEFYTGLKLCTGKTKTEAINIFLECERNAKYFKDVNERIKYNQKLVSDCLEYYGYANRGL